MQWDGTDAGAESVCEWVGPAALFDSAVAGAGRGDPGLLTIDTLEGEMTVSVDDWIIRGVKGEFYPCKPDVFEATYDRV